MSGGCVEGAVYELAQEVLAGGEPVLQRYGVSDDDAFAVGLTCGGILDVFVEAVDATTYPELPAVVASDAAHEPVAVATIVDGPGQLGAHLVVWPDRVAGLARHGPARRRRRRRRARDARPRHDRPRCASAPTANGARTS